MARAGGRVLPALEGELGQHDFRCASRESVDQVNNEEQGVAPTAAAGGRLSAPSPDTGFNSSNAIVTRRVVWSA